MSNHDVNMLTLSLKVENFSLKSSFNGLQGSECHREPPASQAIHWKSMMFLGGVASFSDLGLVFQSLSAPFCLLSREGVKTVPQPLWAQMFVWQAQPGSDSPFPSGVQRAGAQTELGNGHLATGHLVNLAQPCLGQRQPRHPWDLPQQATTQGCVPQAMAKSYLLSYTDQLFCDFSSSCRDFVFCFFLPVSWPKQEARASALLRAQS